MTATASLLHIAIIFGGAALHRFFGAGEEIESDYFVTAGKTWTQLRSILGK